MQRLRLEMPDRTGPAPAESGTPEETWLKFLRDRPEWAPRAGPLVVVSPHPDEEILAAGGLIHAWTAAGRAVTIVSITDGEAAFPGWGGLDLVRRDELKGALRKLCLTHVSVVRMGLPDGKVGHFANRVRNTLLAVLEPRTTLIAPYERDGHCDYAAIGKICVALSRSHGNAVARYPIWAWHHSDPGSISDERWGRFVLSFEARRAKARALQCFASQLNPPRAQPAMSNDVLSHFTRPYEAFIL